MKFQTIPQLYRNFHRSRKIVSVLGKYGLAGWLNRYDLDFVKGLFKDRDGQVLASHSREARIRLAISELGPTFIKLGQILSTRPDLVGNELAEELTALQTNVPADPPDTVSAMIALELGQPVEEIFATFDPVPVASASIGQVHRATLLSGERVAVKIQHAGIQETIRVDLDILSGLAQLAEAGPELKNYRPVATVAEFKRMLRRELDFGRELRSMQQFSLNFAGSHTVHIPRVYPEFSTPRVLTMEWCEGMKLSEASGCRSPDIDLAEVARRGANLYLDMIFVHGFYHADPHPGNIVLLEGNVIGLLDFGMVGNVDQRLKEEMEDLLIALAQQDGERLTSVITHLGAVPPELDQAALGLEISEFVQHYGSQPLEDFNIGAALREMTEIIRRYHIMLPAQIAMLIKVFIMLEGTSRLVSPQFNLLEMMRPYQRRMIWSRLSPARQIKKLKRISLDLEKLAETLPRRIMDILEQIESGRFDVHLDHRGLEPSVNRLVLGMLASALFLGSSLLLSHKLPPLLFERVSVLGLSGCTLAILLALRLLRAINKSGHLDGK
jgi:ubiquinone biosynthesis protein